MPLPDSALLYVLLLHVLLHVCIYSLWECHRNTSKFVTLETLHNGQEEHTRSTFIGMIKKDAITIPFSSENDVHCVVECLKLVTILLWQNAWSCEIIDTPPPDPMDSTSIEETLLHLAAAQSLLILQMQRHSRVQLRVCNCTESTKSGARGISSFERTMRGQSQLV
jgi:hypothetical protein